MANEASVDWSVAAKVYAEAFAKFTGQFAQKAAQRLADDLRPRLTTGVDTIRVLDVACGSGAAALGFIRAIMLMERTCHVELVLSDFSAGMLDACRAAFAAEFPSELLAVERISVTESEDNMEALTRFADGSFDGVLCVFGIMFPPNTLKAAAELRRVLSPGGALYVVTWHHATVWDVVCDAGVHFGKGTFEDMMSKFDSIRSFGSVPHLTKRFTDVGCNKSDVECEFVIAADTLAAVQLGPAMVTNPVFASMGPWNVQDVIAFFTMTYGETFSHRGYAVVARILKPIST